ncbi:MAG TPA: amidohydrolase family protein [Anaerovoracaceae bacterium]|nr:amidohydrolase family protein [Anaerovoracaceae bacterium]
MITLLKNGRIYDGTGHEPYIGSILIEDERIVGAGKEISEDRADNADRIFDLKGLSVSSGFIDAHSHNDWFAIKKDSLPYFEPFVRQGVTTFVTGNCGLSATGFEPESPYVERLGGGLFAFRETTGEYGTMEEFFQAIDRKNPCNIASLIGHCSARAGITGSSNRPLTMDEEEKMLAVLEKAMKQGACGISLGLMYEPGLYADTDELKKAAALCLKYDRPLTVHPRANSAVSMAYPELLGRSHLLRALDELVEIARGTKLKLQYSHAIFVGRKSFKDKDEFLSILHTLREEGVDAGFDIYHEVMGVSVITVILPAWYQSMEPAQRKRLFNKLKLRILCNASGKLLGFGFNDIEIAYIAKDSKRFEGKTVRRIAREMNESDLDTYLYLCEKSGFKGRVNMGPYSTPEIISELSKDDHCLYMTDAWVEENGVQNPAIYDCFPKFLRASLLGTGDTMARTIRKMTGGVADRFSLKDRGYVRDGCFADLTVFNEEKLKSAEPDQGKSFGIEKVFMNGKLVLEDGHIDAALLRNAGHAVRSISAAV